MPLSESEFEPYQHQPLDRIFSPRFALELFLTSAELALAELFSGSVIVLVHNLIGSVDR